MKALILNSGLGKRMGEFANVHPKCMNYISNDDTILSWQLKVLEKTGIVEVVITTGMHHEMIVEYCKSLDLNLKYTFVNNQLCDKTNYIYSIYLARKQIQDDVVLIHGDLVFEEGILMEMIRLDSSAVTVSTTSPLPRKDFKAVIKQNSVDKIGIGHYCDAIALQPLYKMKRADWIIWLDQIIKYCEKGRVSVYAEDALNEVSDKCKIFPFDFKERLCAEIDTPEDLQLIRKRIQQLRAAGEETHNERKTERNCLHEF